MSAKKRKWISVICYAVSLVVFALVFRDNLRQNFWSSRFILTIFTALPLSFVVALIMHTTNAYFKWVYPFLFGIFGFVVLTTVYNLSHILPHITLSFVPPFLGAGLGWLIWKSNKGK